MPTLAIIDDRKNIRETLENLISPILPPNWTTLACAPLEKLSDYASWILEEEISSIIVDQQLADEALPSGKAIRYTGTQFCHSIRRQFPTLPVYLITSYSGPAASKDRSQFEETFERGEFRRDVAVHVERIVRAARRFSEDFEKDLSVLAANSRKIVQGKAKASDRREMDAIRAKLQISFPTEGIESRSKWIESFSSTVNQLSTITTEIQKELNKRSS